MLWFILTSQTLIIVLFWGHLSSEVVARSPTWPNSCILRILLQWHLSGGSYHGSVSHWWCSATLLCKMLQILCCLTVNAAFSLVLGTIPLLRWQGTQSWLHAVTNPVGFSLALIVTNPIEKQLIDFYSLIGRFFLKARGKRLTRQAAEGTKFLQWDFCKDLEGGKIDFKTRLTAVDNRLKTFLLNCWCEQRDFLLGSLCERCLCPRDRDSRKRQQGWCQSVCQVKNW